ncbi:hypothetical protein, partial [Agriterribacter sp.]|uniref:KR prefix domain-containing protein n=1 Tax=Agriterribacter sp. TaxID=2821509 RepID=UPI002CE75109
QPDVMIGHSIGELAAACINGNMSLDEALKQTAGKMFKKDANLQKKLVEWRNNPGVLIMEMIPPLNEKNELENIEFTLGHCWLSGIDINWKQFYEQESRNKVALPTYPFEKERYWMDATWKPGNGKGTHEVTERRPRFYTTHWQMSRHPSESYFDNIAPAGFSYIVFGHPCEFYDALVNNLRSSGKKVIEVVKSDEFTANDELVFGIDPSNPDHYKKLFKCLQSSSLTFETILHLFNFKERSFTFEGNIKERSLNDELHYAFFSLLYIVRALQEYDLQDGIRLEVVASGLHRFHHFEHHDPLKSLLSAACRMTDGMLPDLKWQIVDVDFNLFRPAAIQDVAARLLDELDYEITDHELMLRNTIRLIPVTKIANIPSVNGSVAFKPQNIYLVTGTMNEAIWLFSEYLMKATQAKLVFATGPDFPVVEGWDQWLAGHEINDPFAIMINRFRNWQQSNLEFITVGIDITNYKQVIDLKDAAQAYFGKPDGIFHVDDARRAMSPDPQVEKRISDQVKAVCNLDAVFNSDQPNLFMLCSFDENARYFFDSFARDHYNRFGAKYISACFNRIIQNDIGISGAGMHSIFEQVISAHLPQVVISYEDMGGDLQEHPSKNQYAVQN